MTRLSPSTVCCRACAPWPPGSAMLMPLGRRAESQTPMAACGALAAASHRFRSPVRRGNPGHRHTRQSPAEKMSRLQDALPGDPPRAWQRRPNPLLLNPLLGQAVEAEVAAWLSTHTDKLTDDGRRRLVRHVHLPEREIVTGIGAVAVRCPRVRDRVGEGGEHIRFSST